MFIMTLKSLALTTVASAIISTSAFAASAGDWTVGVGAGYVMPDSDNGSLAKGALSVEVDDNVQPTITGEYFVANNIGIEVLAATPFKHDITLTGADGSKINAETKHLPPTVSLQYHFANSSGVTPFVGVGANYTTFFQERINIAGENDLEIEDSVGVAGHIGLDFAVNDTDAVRVDARYIDLEPDVLLNDKNIGTAEINPWVFGVSYIQTF